MSFTTNADGTKTFVDEIMNTAAPDSPATLSATYGLMASSMCRSGIPFIPLNFSAMVQVFSNPEPWWNAEEGYYMGKYWLESSKEVGKGLRLLPRFCVSM